MANRIKDFDLTGYRTHAVTKTGAMVSIEAPRLMEAMVGLLEELVDRSGLPPAHCHAVLLAAADKAMFDWICDYVGGGRP